MWLLGPFARLVYDQFARIAIRSIESRQRNVLAVVGYPAGEAKGRLATLPILGPIQFSDTVRQELHRRDTLAKSGFRPDARKADRQSRPYRRPEQVKHHGVGRNDPLSGNDAAATPPRLTGAEDPTCRQDAPRGHRYGRLSRNERPRPRQSDQPPRSSF